MQPSRQPCPEKWEVAVLLIVSALDNYINCVSIFVSFLLSVEMDCLSFASRASGPGTTGRHYRKQQGEASITIHGTKLERVSRFRFLRVHISTWPDLNSPHRLHHKDSIKTSLLSLQAGEVQHGFQDTLQLLQVHHWEYPAVLQTGPQRLAAHHQA